MIIKSHGRYRDGGTLEFATNEGPYFVHRKLSHPSLFGSVWKESYPGDPNSVQVTEAEELISFVEALLQYSGLNMEQLEEILTALKKYEEKTSKKSIVSQGKFSAKEIFEESEVAAAIIRRNKEIEAESYSEKDASKVNLDIFVQVWGGGPIHESRVPSFILRHLKNIRNEEDPEFATYLRLKEKFNYR